MNYLLDTNVVSEWVKPRPDLNVIRWLADADEDRIHLSVITFAEIHQGIEGMTPGRRRESLKSWLQDELALRFDGRILGVDLRVAEAWGTVMAQSQAKGVNIGAMDGFFAATSFANDLTLVTRNTKHFERMNVPVLNPWHAKTRK